MVDFMLKALLAAIALPIGVAISVFLISFVGSMLVCICVQFQILWHKIKERLGMEDEEWEKNNIYNV